MLAGDIWDMMNAESEEIKKLKKEHIQNIMKTKSIATELYREVKYSLGYGEFDEPDRKVMYDDIKKLKEENKKLEEEKKEFEEFIKKKCEWEWDDWCAGGRDD